MTILGSFLVYYYVGEYEIFDGICENFNSSDLFLISGKRWILYNLNKNAKNLSLNKMEAN